MSTDDFNILKNQFYGDKSRKLSDHLYPYSIFIKLTLSRIGLSEKQAKSLRIRYNLFEVKAGEIVKARIANGNGILKVLTDPNGNEILGLHFIMKIHMRLSINEGTLAIYLLRGQIYSHPTMSEVPQCLTCAAH